MSWDVVLGGALGAIGYALGDWLLNRVKAGRWRRKIDRQVRARREGRDDGASSC